MTEGRARSARVAGEQELKNGSDDGGGQRGELAVVREQWEGEKNHGRGVSAKDRRKGKRRGRKKDKDRKGRLCEAHHIHTSCSGVVFVDVGASVAREPAERSAGASAPNVYLLLMSVGIN